MSNTLPKKIYKVSFKGVIFPGFDKEQVIENVHNITRIPKHTIARKFFSGKIVVIRRADSQEYASQLQKTFAQAGIETYISEFSESIPNSKESSDSPTEEDSLELAVENTTDTLIGTNNDLDEDDHVKKYGISIIAGVIAIIIIVVAASFYFLNNGTTKTDSISTSLEMNSSKQKDSQTIEQKTKQPQTDLLENKELESNFIEKNEIQRLIKITSPQEVKHLNRFLNTFNLLNGNHGVLSSLLTDLYQQAKDIKPKILQRKNPIPFALPLDSKTPLYLFQTTKHSGVIISTQTTDAEMLVKEIKLQIKRLQTPFENIKQCQQTAPKLSVSLQHGYIFISNFAPTTMNEVTVPKISKQQFSQNLKQLDSLFSLTNKAHQTSFNFYYRYQNKKTNGFISLTSDSKQFWLSMDQMSQNSSAFLLEQLQISTQQANQWQNNKHPNLYALTLILLAQNHLQSHLNNHLATDNTHSNFQAEEIINTDNALLSGKPSIYQRNLDLEFIPQWTAGSFAVAINQFQFDKNLSIELIAKGQNVRNFMEYSHSVRLSIPEVLDKNNENILQHDCSKQTTRSNPTSYFVDTEGEQEAFIDDDFISFQNITAKQIISVKPGYSAHDIKAIKGGIHLSLPKKILQKTLFPKTSTGIFLFNDFSILIKQKTKTNELRYEILGNDKHFITLRAYNESGDILETLAFNKQSELDDTLTHYQQTFSEKIASIKVFYTNELKNTYHFFSIKPEIAAVKIALNPTTEEPSLVSYNPGMLDSKPYGFKPLVKAIQNNNPSWLGKKWPGDKTIWSNKFPFYIDVFMQDAIHRQSPSENSDAVFSIKTNLTPFITQNITAIKLSLFERNKSQLDQFIAFHQQAMDEKSEGDDKFYLSVNKAFKLSKDHQANKHSSHLHGELTFYLPKTFKSHLEPYTSLGQTIDLGELSIKSIRLDGKQLTFEISGELQKLVQLKLYNKADKLISEVFELQHIENNKAYLSLSYQGDIDKIKVVMAQSLAEKKYPFSFSDP